MGAQNFRNLHRAQYTHRQHVQTARPCLENDLLEEDYEEKQLRAANMRKTRQRNQKEAPLDLDRHRENVRLVERLCCVARESEKRQKQILSSSAPLSARTPRKAGNVQPIANAGHVALGTGSMNIAFRRKVAKTIDSENQALLDRIVRVQPAVATRKDLAPEYSAHKQNVKILSRIRRPWNPDMSVEPPSVRPSSGSRPSPWRRAPVPSHEVGKSAPTTYRSHEGDGAKPTSSSSWSRPAPPPGPAPSSKPCSSGSFRGSRASSRLSKASQVGELAPAPAPEPEETTPLERVPSLSEIVMRNAYQAFASSPRGEAASVAHDFCSRLVRDCSETLLSQQPQPGAVAAAAAVEDPDAAVAAHIYCSRLVSDCSEQLLAQTAEAAAPRAEAENALASDRAAAQEVEIEITARANKVAQESDDDGLEKAEEEVQKEIKEGRDVERDSSHGTEKSSLGREESNVEKGNSSPGSEQSSLGKEEAENQQAEKPKAKALAAEEEDEEEVEQQEEENSELYSDDEYGDDDEDEFEAESEGSEDGIDDANEDDSPGGSSSSSGSGVGASPPGGVGAGVAATGGSAGSSPSASSSRSSVAAPAPASAAPVPASTSRGSSAASSRRSARSRSRSGSARSEQVEEPVASRPRSRSRSRSGSHVGSQPSSRASSRASSRSRNPTKPTQDGAVRAQTAEDPSISAESSVSSPAGERGGAAATAASDPASASALPAEAEDEEVEMDEDEDEGEGEGEGEEEEEPPEMVYSPSFEKLLELNPEFREELQKAESIEEYAKGWLGNPEKVLAELAEQGFELRLK